MKAFTSLCTWEYSTDLNNMEGNADNVFTCFEYFRRIADYCSFCYDSLDNTHNLFYHEMQPSEFAQKVEDSAIELNSFILKWNKLHSCGTSVLSSVKNLKIKSMKTSDTIYVKTYPEGLQEKCNQLEAIVVEMETAVGTLQLLGQQLTALCQLDQIQNKSYSTPFRSWSTDKFRGAFQDIYETYSQELALKKFIKQEIAHSSNRDILLMHVAAWDCQPFITNSCILICKSVFEESGVAQR